MSHPSDFFGRSNSHDGAGHLDALGTARQRALLQQNWANLSKVTWLWRMLLLALGRCQGRAWICNASLRLQLPRAWYIIYFSQFSVNQTSGKMSFQWWFSLDGFNTDSGVVYMNWTLLRISRLTIPNNPHDCGWCWGRERFLGQPGIQ